MLNQPKVKERSMRRSSINNLPVETVIEVKRRLRSGSYDQLDIVKWLNSLGYNISKSALNRYSMRLNKQDLERGLDREALSVQDVDAVALFEELSEIKERETEILAKLQTLLTS